MRTIWVALLALGLLACGDDDTTPDGGIDAGADAANGDAGDDDASTADGGDEDAGPVDGGPIDGGAVDGGPVDGGPPFMSCAEVFIPFTGPIPSMTIDATDDFDPPDHASCPFGRFTGPDRVYALVASLGAGTYEVIATPIQENFDLMLYVLATCDAEECLAGTRLNGPGEAERVQVALEADQVVYVVIDTLVESTPGAFVLVASKLDD